MAYFCPQCKREVEPIMGEFKHPHHGTCVCTRCPKCGSMVYPKDDDRKVPA